MVIPWETFWAKIIKIVNDYFNTNRYHYTKGVDYNEKE